MTTNQKQIIDALVNEFNRIESMHKPSTTFSLINADVLNEKTNEILQHELNENADKEAWDKIANEEARRLVRIFKSDLPTASVQKSTFTQSSTCVDVFSFRLISMLGRS